MQDADKSVAALADQVTGLLRSNLELVAERQRMEIRLTEALHENASLSSSLSACNELLRARNGELTQRVEELEARIGAETKPLQQELNDLLKHFSLVDEERLAFKLLAEHQIHAQRSEIEQLRSQVTLLQSEGIELHSQSSGKEKQLAAFARSDVSVQRQAILASGAFDAHWYSSQYALPPGTDPLSHYLEHGASAGHMPNANFDGKRYTEDNKDVAGQGMNPLYHYLVYGKDEGRAFPRAKRPK